MTRNSTIRLTNLWPSNSRSNWNLEMLVFEERGKPDYPEKSLSSKTRTKNKLNLHLTPSPRIEPGSHSWEANAQPLRHPCDVKRLTFQKEALLTLTKLSVRKSTVLSPFTPARKQAFLTSSLNSGRLYVRDTNGLKNAHSSINAASLATVALPVPPTPTMCMCFPG